MDAIPSLALGLSGVRRNRHRWYESPWPPKVLFSPRQARHAINFFLALPVIPTRLMGARTPHSAATREAMAAISPVWVSS